MAGNQAGSSGRYLLKLLTFKTSKTGKRSWFRIVIGSVFVMNVLDGLLTLVWKFSLIAEEANPLMAGLIAFNPVLFIITKMALVYLGLTLLWRYRHTQLALLGGGLGFVCYASIIVVHLSLITPLIQ
jgi:hypothetical protein